MTLPTDSRLVKQWLAQPLLSELTVALFQECEPFMKSQMTWKFGWPSRPDASHQMARFGDEGVTYTYKGKPKPVHPWTPSLLEVAGLVDRSLSWRPNCACVNVYGPDGDLFPHNDSSYIPQLGPEPTIASVSFGEARTLKFFPLNARGKRDKTNIIDVLLEPGDLFVMSGSCDASHHHAIEPEPDRTGLRLSITFRRHLDVA